MEITIKTHFMRSCRFMFSILVILILTEHTVYAQRTLVLSDSLVTHADVLPVKMGGQGFGKTWKFKFGEYGVVSSKAGWTVSSSKSNFFNTKTENKSTQKFSFVMTNRENDSAKVNAAINISSKTLNEIELLPNFSWGSDEVLKETVNFSAFISVNGDTSNTWVLLMKNERGAQTGEKYEALLTNGDRKIFIYPTSSNINGKDNRSLPALGYEFMEGDQFPCALQYWGGGMLGANKNIVWLNRDPDPRMKLILSATMTAILQLKTSEMNIE
jgi:hypothetical protein